METQKQLTLKEQIESRGVKKSWIAEKLKIKQSTLANYLLGFRNMPDDVEKRIKTLLDIK